MSLRRLFTTGVRVRARPLLSLSVARRAPFGVLTSPVLLSTSLSASGTVLGSKAHSTAAGPALSSADAIRSAMASPCAVLVDLRSTPERAEQPGPAAAKVWDFNASPAAAPSGVLPEEKTTPIVLY